MRRRHYVYFARETDKASYKLSMNLGRFPGSETEFSLTLTDPGKNMINLQLLMYISSQSTLSKLSYDIHVAYVIFCF